LASAGQHAGKFSGLLYMVAGKFSGLKPHPSKYSPGFTTLRYVWDTFSNFQLLEM
jgi:hypothetical protein